MLCRIGWDNSYTPAATTPKRVMQHSATAYTAPHLFTLALVSYLTFHSYNAPKVRS